MNWEQGASLGFGAREVGGKVSSFLTSVVYWEGELMGSVEVRGLEIREPLNSRVATYLRGHVDQAIRFIVGDTKAQRGEGTG